MNADLRLRCYIVHFAGAGSAFAGGSTRSTADRRRHAVERVIEATRALPFDVDVRVAGIPGAALVPIDLDLSAVEDPRHLVYAAIEDLIGAADEVDAVLCLEDDVLVEAGAIERMLRFAAAREVNEILLPNRIEHSPTGRRTSPDLPPGVFGWAGLRGEFEGAAIDVNQNPHSGIALLTRDQARYARRRVDLARREEFWGGYMASAFANLHRPFLVWRPASLDGDHTVEHLDRWTHPAMRVTLPVEAGFTEGRIGAALHHVAFDGTALRLHGWTSTPGDPLPRTWRLGDGPDRPLRARPAEGSIGQAWVAAADLRGLPATELEADAVEVRGDGFALRADWPVDAAVFAAATRVRPPDAVADDAAERHVRERLADAMGVLVYGARRLGRLAVDAGVPEITCVETDLDRLEALSSAAGSGTRFVPVDADLGAVDDAGTPTRLPDGTAAADHAQAVWEDPPWSRPPALVLVDGAFRIAAALAAGIAAPGGTPILVADYADRPSYRVLETALGTPAMHGRLAEFRAPNAFGLRRARALLRRHAADPR